MADNVRDVIRSAQAAELGGDKPRAIELLRLAASMYQRAGSSLRALNLLRYALKLEPSRSELLAEVARLEALSGEGEGRERPGSGSLVAPEPALFDSAASVDSEEEDEGGVWVIEEEGGSLEEALREAELSVGSVGQREAPVGRREDPVGRAVEALRSAVIRAEELARTERTEVERSAAVAVTVEAHGLASGVRDALVGELGGSDAPREIPHPSPLPKGEGVFVERGPTRADPSLEAWCSFCCRPRSEVGSLVAGPAGAFICSSCVSESGSLLGTVPSPAPARRSVSRPPDSLSLVGQEGAQSSLARALESGVRRLLLIGPEGSGKSTWLRSLEEQGRGVRVSPDSLEQAPFDALLLIEDVDRLSPESQASLAAFLARSGQRSVLLSARGSPASPGPVLLSDSGRLPLLTTASLSQAVQGSLPVALLEQVQHLVALEAPSVEVLVEVARRQLASQRSLSDEALFALASEAARSPRSGHELRALLSRVPPGSWRLEAPSKPAARRARRKGTS